MKKNNLVTRPDVLMVYQDKASVELCIQQISELNLKFKSCAFEAKSLYQIKEMKPQVLLISSNSVKRSVQFYIEYLEENEQDIAPHRAILLINNRETLCAYLACENGLFDDYVIINPLNEPYRLKLVLLQQLNIIKTQVSDGLAELTEKGEDELASCIEHGVILKRTFINEVNLCKGNILDNLDKSLENQETKAIIEKIINLSLDELHTNISSDVDNIIERLVEFKEKNTMSNEDCKHSNIAKTQAIIEASSEILEDHTDTTISENTNKVYKVLIAEPCDLFRGALEEIFTDTVFECLFVSDGKMALIELKKFNPDVLLLAYDLPFINGIEITKAIRNKGSKIPIVAYTQQRDVSVIKTWITYGLNGYLIKPSKKSLILKSINNAIQQPVDILKHSESTNNKIQWIPEYSVGNKALDDQHKVLFDMINEFFQQSGKQAAISIFENLSSYIDLHFEDEENLLKQINYPKTTEHIAQHDELRVKFALLLKKLENYNVEVHHKIALFLYNWLASHILKDDMDYKDYALSIEEESFINSLTMHS